MEKQYFEIEKNYDTIRGEGSAIDILDKARQEDPTRPMFEGFNGIYEGFSIKGINQLHKFKVGDRVRFTRPKDEEVIVIITELYPDGTYEWKYPFSDETFISANSNDIYMNYWESLKT